MQGKSSIRQLVGLGFRVSMIVIIENDAVKIDARLNDHIYFNTMMMGELSMEFTRHIQGTQIQHILHHTFNVSQSKESHK